MILEVDERDIASLVEGERGDLILSGLPGQPLPFTVRQITPVATQMDGRNFFRVEAQLETNAAHVRPGMEGVGKVTIGTRKLFWIWTHRFIDWANSWIWMQMP